MAPDVTPELKHTLTKELALQNANETCGRLIAPLQSGYSLSQMVEICALLLWEEEKAKIHASAMAVALKQTQGQGKSSKGLKGVCYS